MCEVSFPKPPLFSLNVPWPYVFAWEEKDMKGARGEVFDAQKHFKTLKNITFERF